MMIPRPVYETLPVLYIAGGIAAMLTVDSFMSFVSGILLGVSGVVVLFLRRNYRTFSSDEQWQADPQPPSGIESRL